MQTRRARYVLVSLPGRAVGKEVSLFSLCWQSSGIARNLSKEVNIRQGRVQSKKTPFAKTVMPGGAKANVEKKSCGIHFDGVLPSADRVVVECECVGHLAGNENGVMGWRSFRAKRLRVFEGFPLNTVLGQRLNARDP